MMNANAAFEAMIEFSRNKTLFLFLRITSWYRLALSYAFGRNVEIIEIELRNGLTPTDVFVISQ